MPLFGHERPENDSPANALRSHTPLFIPEYDYRLLACVAADRIFNGQPTYARKIML